MIEAKLALFQMMKKLVGTKAVELLHTAFRKRPKALDAVDVIRAVGKLVIAMIHTEMFCKTYIDQAIVTAPFVGVDNNVKTDFPSYNGLQRAFLTVRDDLGVDPTVPFENAKDDCLATCPASAFSTDPSAAKVGLVDLDLTGPDRCVTGTFFDKADTYFLKDRIDTFPSDLCQLGRLPGSQIHREISQYLTKFLLSDSGTAVIPI